MTSRLAVVCAIALTFLASSANAVILQDDAGNFFEEGAVASDGFTMTVTATELADGFVQYMFHVGKSSGAGINSLVVHITSPTGVSQVLSQFSPTAPTLFNDSNPIIDAGFGIPSGRNSMFDTQFAFSSNTATVIFETEVPPGSGNFVQNTFEDGSGIHGLMIFVGPAVVASRNIVQVVVAPGTGVGGGSQDTILDYELLVGAADSDAEFRGRVVNEIPEPASLAVLGLGGLLMARRRKTA